jgi:hypothetical protein
MRDIRQGNDIAVIWSLMSDGKPFQLQGRALKLYLKNMYGSKEITDFSVKGNQIHWTFFGKDQKSTGRYSLTLVANENEVGMITVDTCDFVRLVSHSCAVCCDSDSPNVETETIELTSTLEYVTNVEQGGSYDDTAIWAEVSRLEKDKVDKEEDKGLSSNDFTNEEKQKLAGLRNYDDTALRTAIQGKQNTIVDLESIRRGASLGATALQSIPSVFATKNDVANAIAEAVTNVLNTEV